nr:thymidine kinase [Candidatus Hydrogenosomobacter endosymbioticus]
MLNFFPVSRLVFYYSAMNAGKTTALLQTNYNYRECGMNTLCFLPSLITDRIGSEKIISRIGIESPCISFNNEFRFDHFVMESQESQSISCALIDEAQFLTKSQVWQLCYIADYLNISVLTYGLRTDFQGNLFEGSKHLLAWADEIEEIKTVCFCGKNATMVVRLDQDGNAVTNGEQLDQAGSRYVSFCRKHYRESVQDGGLSTRAMFSVR